MILYVDLANNIVCSNCGKGFHKKCFFKLPDLYNVFNWLCTCCETSQISKTPDCATFPDVSIESESTFDSTSLSPQSLHSIYSYDKSFLMFEDYDTTGFNLNENKYITSNETKCLSFNNKFRFTILNINMRSLENLNNYFKFETLITSLNPQPDIISVTETWLIEQSGLYCSPIGYTHKLT